MRHGSMLHGGAHGPQADEGAEILNACACLQEVRPGDTHRGSDPDARCAEAYGVRAMGCGRRVTIR